LARIIGKDRKNPHGETFEVWWECSSCGRRVFIDDNFCRHCGVRFG
jgi:zinc-ribbon domain